MSGHRLPPLLLLCTYVATILPSLCHGQLLGGIGNSKSLKRAIYTELKQGDACIKLLHASGSVGCEAPSRAPVEGPLVRITELGPAENYPDRTVFLLPPYLLDDFLLTAAANPALQSKAEAVLVEAGSADGFSPAPSSPLADFALYSEKGYQWNPQGTGLNLMSFPFPVFLLDNSTTASAQQRAQYNSDRGMSGALNVARMKLGMDAAGNSSACLAASTCIPLGGHSVAAALPPLRNATGPEGNLPLIMVLAAMDTTAFFHGTAQGANAPYSGLVATLAAAQILGAAGGGAGGAPGADYTRHVVFTALAGETWGYMGSKRMLWEMTGQPAGQASAFSAAFPSSTAGLDLASVETVIEVRQVGRALGPDGGASFYMHHRKGHNNTLQLWQTMKDAAANTTEVPVSIARASASTPGLPPSSANSFLRVGSDSIRAAVIEDFDTQFRSSTYESIYDTVDTVNATSIAAAALLVARAVHVLALGDTPPFPPLPVNYTAVLATVNALLDCLLGSKGLRCPLALAMMTPVAGGSVPRYISVLRTITEDPQKADPASKSDLSRFIWNFLAFATAGVDPLAPWPGSAGGQGPPLARCQPYNASACRAGDVCAGYRSVAGEEGKGACLPATVRFIPAFSTSLVCDGCNGSSTLYDFRWKLTNAAQQWEQMYSWPPDPLWTESNWPLGTPHLELFLKEAGGVDWAVMISGLVVSAVAGAVALATHAAYEKRMKQS